MKRFIFKNLLMTAVTILSLGVMCFVTDIRDKDIELEEEAVDETQTEEPSAADRNLVRSELLASDSYEVYGAFYSQEKEAILIVTPDEQQVVLETDFKNYGIELSKLDIDHDGTEDAVLTCRKLDAYKNTYKIYFIMKDNNEYKVYSCEDLSKIVKNDINLTRDSTDGEVVLTKLSSGETIKYYQKLDMDYVYLYFSYCYHTEIDPDNNLIRVYPACHIISDYYDEDIRNASCVIYYRFSLDDGKINVDFADAVGFSECSDQLGYIVDYDGFPEHYAFSYDFCGDIECYRYFESDGFVFDDETTRYENLYGLSDNELIESREIYTGDTTKIIDVYHKEKDDAYFVFVCDTHDVDPDQNWFEIARITGLSDIDNNFGGYYHNIILIQPFIFLTSSGETLDDKVSAYREEKEYDEKGNLVRFTSYGVIGDETNDEYELLNREYIYNGDNRLISWYQYENYPWSPFSTPKSELFEDKYCNQRFMCDDSGKTFFQTAVKSLERRGRLSDGVFDFYYIYGDGDKPEYVICIPYDCGGMKMLRYPDTDAQEFGKWIYKDYNEAFAGVLRMDDKIWDVGNGKWCFIDEFKFEDCLLCSYGDNLKWGKLPFSVVDMDGDGENEVVLTDYSHNVACILHYCNGKIYGYGMSGRNVEDLKKNGYYFIPVRFKEGCYHISGFADSGYIITQPILCHDIHGTKDRYYYYGLYDSDNPLEEEDCISAEIEITEYEFNDIWDKIYDSSPNIEFYERTEDNIELFFGADENGYLSLEASDEN